jgi:renalase
MAATELVRTGHRVTVVDKGRSVGGRLATRRITVPASAGAPERVARFDHGAQFFTVRDPEFASFVAGWEAAGLVRTWCHGFGPVGDGHPRYVVNGGMVTLAKHLAAELSADPRFALVVDTELSSIHHDSGRVRLKAVEGNNFDVVADSVIVTSPVPQTLALLDRGGFEVDAEIRSRLDAVSYVPCVALLVVLDGPSSVQAPGGEQLGQENEWFSFIGDNRAKAISEVDAVTFHCTDDVSRRLWDVDPAEATQIVLDACRPWLGGRQVLAAELKRWRYARPLVTDPSPALVSGRCVFAGDGFAGAKVEGAALSGLAAARLAAGFSSVG